MDDPNTVVTEVEKLRHGAKNLTVEVIVLSITPSRYDSNPTVFHVADGTSVSHNLAIKPMYYFDLVVLAKLNLQVTSLHEASVCQLRVTLPSKKLATLVGPTTSTAERR